MFDQLTKNHPVASLEKAFGTQLWIHDVDGVRVRGRQGPLTIPEDLGGAVEGVFGLVARHEGTKAFYRLANEHASQMVSDAIFQAEHSLGGVPRHHHTQADAGQRESA